MKTVLKMILFFLLFLQNLQALSNALLCEESPYLRQHAFNPVAWQSWGERAFKEAQKLDKPLFLSIGYATCHWCHVMAKESFENNTTAALINRYFVPVKIDREELSDVDAYFGRIYFEHYGVHAGWPMNVFVTPSLEPFYITGYIPQKEMPALLQKMNSLFHSRNALKEAIEALKKTQTKKESKSRLTPEVLRERLDEEYDDFYGGFGSGSKFAQASKVELLYDLSYFLDDATLKNHYYETLDAMALGGMYDHIDGGFFRYSTESSWEIPHFEKMLYSQAEMIMLYTNAYNRSHKKLYKSVVRESIAFVQNHLQSKEGLFFSAVDAQSNKIEGFYTTFAPKEIQAALQKNPHAQEIKAALSSHAEPNFGKRVHIAFESAMRPKGFESFKKSLHSFRKKRPFPFVDRKINTAWNAMYIEALFHAGTLDKKYTEMARLLLETLLEELYRNDRLYHQKMPAAKPTKKALLEDYAFVVGALIASYEADFHQKDLLLANYLLLEAKKRFYHNGQWYLSESRLGVKAKRSDRYYMAAQNKIVRDFVCVATLRESLKDAAFFKKNLKQMQNSLAEKNLDSAALAQLFLMQKYGVVLLKSSSENLREHAKEIAQITYPYILLKAEKYEDFEACTLKQCFAKERDFKAVKKKIELFKRNF